MGGDAVGHVTALLKLVHELQHEVGDVATLVQCGMRCALWTVSVFLFFVLVFFAGGAVVVVRRCTCTRVL